TITNSTRMTPVTAIAIFLPTDVSYRLTTRFMARLTPSRKQRHRLAHRLGGLHEGRLLVGVQLDLDHLLEAVAAELAGHPQELAGQTELALEEGRARQY